MSGIGLDRNRLRARLLAVLMLIVTFSVLVVGLAAVVAFDRAVAPELASRTRLIGSIVRAEIQRTVELGIPLSAVGGLESYLSEALAQVDENWARLDRDRAHNLVARDHR